MIRHSFKPFSVTVSTVMKRSKAPLTKWLLAAQLMASSKKGGEGKIIEADEMYIGGKGKNKHANKKLKKGRGNVGKMPVVSLVERDGKTRSFHIANVTGTSLLPVLLKHIDAKSKLATDESGVYLHVGKEFAAHGTVNDTAGEYVRADGTHTNTVESSFALLKRGFSR